MSAAALQALGLALAIALGILAGHMAAAMVSPSTAERKAAFTEAWVQGYCAARAQLNQSTMQECGDGMRAALLAWGWNA